MDHDEALELLELAAVEPLGFERLAAGDTPESSALASHLAGCPDCASNFEALGRASAAIREVVRELPPADLRERTLAFVAATGRVATADASGLAVSEASPPRDDTPVESIAPAATARRGRGAWWPPLAAAAVLIAAIGLGGWWTARSALEDEQAISTELAAVSEAALHVQAQPDDQVVPLAATTRAPAATGTMSYSKSANELVVVADGLGAPPSGSGYRCWVEVGGQRTDIGPMHLGGGKAYWAGWAEVAEQLGPGSRFGVGVAVISVTLSDPAQDVLTGQL